MRVISFLFLCTFLVASNISLKGVPKTTNLYVGSVDTQEVLQKVDKYYKSYDFTTLSKDKKGIQKHLNRLDTIEANLKTLASLRSQLEINYEDIKQLEVDIKNFKKYYNKKINRIYKNNSSLDRYTYIVVASKIGDNYKKELQNFLVENYAITKYDQSTTLEKSLASTKMQNIIKTKKEFGQKSVEDVYDFVIRANNVVIKILRVTQNPFVKFSSNDKTTTTHSSMVFDSSKSKIYDIKDIDTNKLITDIQQYFKLSDVVIKPFASELKSKVNISKYKKEFDKSSKKIVSILQKLENTHKTLAPKGVALQDEYSSKKELAKNISKKLTTLLQQTQKLLKPYNISLTKENIGTISIVTPKIYSEKVQYKEEKEYIHRKVKAYISGISVTSLQQSETLIDFSDLSSETKKQHKLVEFETIHTLPFLDNNNKIGVLVFSSIAIKTKVDENDLVKFDFKYDTINFVPIKKGYKTIFVAQTEVTLGIVKEFLEHNLAKKYFDQYCIDESFLPEEAKDFKNISQEYYRYPAICFKVDKIDGFINWVSKKTKRDITIPSVADWEYVASNSDTTDYCWGDATPEELEEEEQLPENIYLENSDIQSSIMPVAKFPKSKAGVYDMCGNVFELTKQDGELTYKGNSFSSYIEESRGDAEYYSDEVNPSLGLRLFYIKDLTNE